MPHDHPEIQTSSRPRRRQQFLATVHSNESICREHFRLIFRLPVFPSTDPGQFIQISCREIGIEQSSGDEVIEWDREELPHLNGRELAAPLALLRRPFSLAGRHDTAQGVELEIIHRVVGIGTDWLASLKAGQTVSILGPLGNRFELPATENRAILVGGGVGIPPMLYLAERLQSRGCSSVAFCGATTRDLLALNITGESDPRGIDPRLCIAEFAQLQVPSIVTTDDGSYGFRGFVTQALERWLDVPANHPERAVIYTCGPEPMMKRVAEIAMTRQIPCQIAVERAMACGMGTCQSCVIRAKKPDPAQPPLEGKDWCWRLACTDGPVFKATELMW